MNAKPPRRLDKFLADANVGTKRAIEALAQDVRVNGALRALHRLVDPCADVVEVRGVRVELVAPQHYAVLHKPKGVLTSLSDPRGRACVSALIPDAWRGAVPVGRLDRATTGALLITDDGDLNHLMTHPDFHVWKRYVMTVLGEPEADDPRLARLREGFTLGSQPTLPARCGVVPGSGRPGTGDSRLSDVWIEIREGRNRQVRRMASRVRLKIIHLHRAAIGPIALDGVPEGQWRALRSDEIDALYDAAGGRDAPARGARAAMRRRLEAGDLDDDEVAIVTRYLTTTARADPATPEDAGD